MRVDFGCLLGKEGRERKGREVVLWDVLEVFRRFVKLWVNEVSLFSHIRVFHFSSLIFGLGTSLENGVDYLSICLEDASSEESWI